jgi:hypothetical protein
MDKKEYSSEELDLLIKNIESQTDYDVLNWNSFEINVICRDGFGGEADRKDVQIYGKTMAEIIGEIKQL